MASGSVPRCLSITARAREESDLAPRPVSLPGPGGALTEPPVPAGPHRVIPGPGCWASGSIQGVGKGWGDRPAGGSPAGRLRWTRRSWSRTTPARSASSAHSAGWDRSFLASSTRSATAISMAGRVGSWAPSAGGQAAAVVSVEGGFDVEGVVAPTALLRRSRVRADPGERSGGSSASAATRSGRVRSRAASI